MMGYWGRRAFWFIAIFVTASTSLICLAGMLWHGLPLVVGDANLFGDLDPFGISRVHPVYLFIVGLWGLAISGTLWLTRGTFVDPEG